jgi:hypothetical protein
MMPRPAASRKRKSLQRAKPVPNRIENNATVADRFETCAAQNNAVPFGPRVAEV